MLLRLIPVALAALVLAAHFVRDGSLGIAAVALLAPFLLLLKSRWVLTVGPLLLVLGAATWLDTLRTLVEMRMAFGEPWTRMAAILGGVAVFTLVSAGTLRSRFWLQRKQQGQKNAFASSLAFFLTAISLYFVQTRVSYPMLLAERFWPGGGWIEILFLSVYAAILTEKMQDTARVGQIRRRIWLIFSLVFFGQLILGLLGNEIFLMTGKLHLPVPAMIAAGPIYRGTRFFMPILFGITILLVGPAWCSHLCYLGSFDNLAAIRKKRPSPLPSWTNGFRIGILVGVIATALLLRLLGISSFAAALAGGIFGILGVGIILTWSRKHGVMTHCTIYCPIGLMANVLGKLSPFRIRIDSDCNNCGLCTRACRYDALRRSHIATGKPGYKCTLCGDCLSSCKDSLINYSFFGWQGNATRRVFLAIVLALHAVFLGVARI